jgi:hypothetical protein
MVPWEELISFWIGICRDWARVVRLHNCKRGFVRYSVDADYPLLPPYFFRCQDGLNCTTYVLQLGDVAKPLQVRKRISAVVGMCGVSRAYMVVAFGFAEKHRIAFYVWD